MSTTTPGADRSIWDEPEHKRRSPLTREAIVEAAMRVADEEGVAAMSIRRVAATLEARVMSLYSHIDSKNDLLALMSDEIAGEVLIEGELPADWREAITMIARRERDVALRHRWIPELLNYQERVQIGPNALRHAEQSMAALSGLELKTQDALQVLATVDEFMLGYTVRALREFRQVGSDAIGPGERAELTSTHVQVLIERGEFPHMARVLKDGLPRVEDNFERGLKWLLDGIEKEYG